MARLRNWAAGPKRKPLVLRGARQVGKTTLVKQFSRDYETFLHLNLDKGADKQLFEDDRVPMDELLTSIYLQVRKKRRNGRTLLFIDEIQNSPKAVARLRYFYEEVPQIDVIAAGSLLESLIDRNITFPVGRVEYLALRPCSFNEFLGAMGEHGLKEAQRSLAIPAPLHDTMMRLFNSYALVGGMPEAVQSYADDRDIVSLGSIYEALLAGYRDDVEKYAKKDSSRNTIRHILDVEWAYAGQRISFEKFGKSLYRSREMGEAFRTLERAMLLELVHPVTSVLAPLASENKRSPKLLWLDTGLVNYVAGMQVPLTDIRHARDSWTGCVTEHLVGQELLGGDHVFSHRRHFWVKGTGSDAEVDYAIQLDGMVIPIEVKAGHNSRLRSLHEFMDIAPHDVAVRFWGEPFSVDSAVTRGGKRFRLLNLPYYYAGFVTDALGKFI